MSKELDYLDKILNYQPLTLVERTIIECIKEKIHRLESIDNANPSEALECLEKLKGMEISSMPFSDEYGTQEVDLNDIRKVGSQLNTDFREYTNTIKQALLKQQEQEKVLEIIKNKQVDVCELKICIDEYEDSLYQYNKRTIEKFRLTEEEFDLLKEVL